MSHFAIRTRMGRPTERGSSTSLDKIQRSIDDVSALQKQMMLHQEQINAQMMRSLEQTNMVVSSLASRMDRIDGAGNGQSYSSSPRFTLSSRMVSAENSVAPDRHNVRPARSNR